MSDMEATWEYIRGRFCEFLEEYSHGSQQSHYYLDQLQTMHQEEISTMYVNFEHLNIFDTDLADLILVRTHPASCTLLYRCSTVANFKPSIGVT